MKPEDVLRIAESEIGVFETPGPESTKRILEYHDCTSLDASDDETPWCSSFVNWVIRRAGGKGTNSAMARSFLKWGVPITDPFPGCIVVLKRGKAPSGHVGIFKYRRSPGGWVHVVGGNQSDQVRVSLYQEADVLGYRWEEET
jgi:uncharacterized protein (TIGR02594 family)